MSNKQYIVGYLEQHVNSVTGIGITYTSLNVIDFNKSIIVFSIFSTLDSLVDTLTLMTESKDSGGSAEGASFNVTKYGATDFKDLEPGE